MKDKTFAEHFLKLEGRLNRLRYLKRILVLMLIGAIIGAVAGVIFHADTGEFELVIIIMSFCMMPMQYCLAVRRLAAAQTPARSARTRQHLRQKVLWSVPWSVL